MDKFVWKSILIRTGGLNQIQDMTNCDLERIAAVMNEFAEKVSKLQE